MFSAYSGISMGDVQDALEPSEQSVESQMRQMMDSLANNPDPSPADMVEYQANLQVYMTLISMQSSVTTDVGTMLKQIAQNMGN